MDITLFSVIIIYLTSFGLFIRASVTDFQKREISNELNLMIALLGVGLHSITGDMNALLFGVIFGIIMYGAGYLAFRFGLIGGGDVKMWTAGAIFFGGDATLFIKSMALYGFALAIFAILAARRAKKLGLELVNSDDKPMPRNFLHNLGCPEVPYGFAITASGLTIGIQNMITFIGGY